MASKLIKKISLFFLPKAFLLFGLILFSSFEPNTTRPYGLTKVVIDAGHGGHDSGCLGKIAKEKDIALGIALKLGKYIEDNFQDVKVIYTRKEDVFVELHERANIANNAKAELFICIHSNSACVFNKVKKKEICNTQIKGVETWVMGLNKTEENLEVAKRENEVILMEKDYTRQYGGFDPNSPEANIIFSLYQNIYLDKSLKMASYIQQEMKTRGRPVRGVKQAGFLVLYKTSMPGVLIETGFMSNPEEEKYLVSQKGQDQMAHSIFKAFKAYKNSLETQKSEPDPVQRTDTPVTRKTEDKDEKKPVVKPGNVPGADTGTTSPPVKETATTSSGNNDIIQWSVQFYTSPKPIPDNSKIYDAFDDVREDFDNGVYKYSTGLLSEKGEAIKLQAKIRQKGYADAFVIAFLNGKRISLKEAAEKSKK